MLLSNFLIFKVNFFFSIIQIFFFEITDIL